MWCIEWCHFQRTDDTRATGTLSVGNANQVDVGVGPHYTMWPPFCQSLVGACLISPSWRHQQCTRKWLLRVHHLLQANRSRILECRQRRDVVTGYGSQSARRGQQCTGQTGPASTPTPTVLHTRHRWRTTVTTHNARTASDQTDTTGTCTYQ